MLGHRIVASAVILSIIVVAVAVDRNHPAWHGLPLLPLAVPFALLAAGEMSRLAAMRPPAPAATALAGVTLVLLAAAIPMAWDAWGGGYPHDCPVGRLGWLLWGTLLAGGLLAAAAVVTFRPDDAGRLERLAKTVWVVVYPGLLFAFLVLLRQVGTHGWGLTMVVAVILIPKAGDTGAYFGGRRFGRRKLAPRLSPGKTIEGGVAGILAAMAAAGCYFAWIAPALFGVGSIRGGSVWRSLLLGGVLAVVGIMGDLFESMLKRDAGVKDSSGWLPGLGGILDTVDSILFCAPVGYAFCLANWQGAGVG